MTEVAKRRRWPRVMAGILSCLVLPQPAPPPSATTPPPRFSGNVNAGTDGNFTGNQNLATPGAPINILLMA